MNTTSPSLLMQCVATTIKGWRFEFWLSAEEIEDFRKKGFNFSMNGNFIPDHGESRSLDLAIARDTLKSALKRS